MDPVALLMMVAVPAIPMKPGEPGRYDIDAPIKAAIVDLNSPEMRDHVTEAMAWPYKFGVSQMPCKAQSLQPEREWKPVREPSGKIQWIQGPVTKVLWGGIYGICYIQTREEKSQLEEAQRAALECECNGWKAGR